MKLFPVMLLLAVIATLSASGQTFPEDLPRNKKEQWTKNQLIEPAALASMIKDPKAVKSLFLILHL